MANSEETKFKFSGDMLLIRRKLLNYSRKELGKHIGVTGVSVKHWEDEKATPNPWHLDKLAKFFDTKPEHMVVKDLSERARVLNVKL